MPHSYWLKAKSLSGRELGGGGAMLLRRYRCWAEDGARDTTYVPCKHVTRTVATCEKPCTCYRTCMKVASLLKTRLRVRTKNRADRLDVSGTRWKDGKPSTAAPCSTGQDLFLVFLCPVANTRRPCVRMPTVVAHMNKQSKCGPRMRPCTANDAH
jgi:hypothetical protein